MIYIADPHFPITRFQIFFKGGLLTDPSSHPGLTLITQRQYLRGTQFRDHRTQDCSDRDHLQMNSYFPIPNPV